MLQNLCSYINRICYINQNYSETQYDLEILSYDNQNESTTSETSNKDIVSASFTDINETTEEKENLIEKISHLPLVKCAVHEPGLNFFLSLFGQSGNILTLFILKKQDEVADSTNKDIELFAYTQLERN